MRKPDETYTVVEADREMDAAVWFDPDGRSEDGRWSITVEVTLTTTDNVYTAGDRYDGVPMYDEGWDYHRSIARDLVYSAVMRLAGRTS